MRKGAPEEIREMLRWFGAIPQKGSVGRCWRLRVQFHWYCGKRHVPGSICNRLGARLRRNSEREISEIHDSHRPGFVNLLTELIILATWNQGAGDEKLGSPLFHAIFGATAKWRNKAYARSASWATVFRDAVGNDLGSFPPKGKLANEAGAHFRRQSQRRKPGTSRAPRNGGLLNPRKRKRGRWPDTPQLLSPWR